MSCSILNFAVDNDATSKTEPLIAAAEEFTCTQSIEASLCTTVRSGTTSDKEEAGESVTDDNQTTKKLSSTNNVNNNTSPQPPPTKSCLSRHNSTHTSVKKRVNISVHAEIIEPEPLPLPPLPTYQTASVGDEEDDVFSDSLPPPKRDSMCAPYIERDDDNDDIASESLAYAHGLPEWFNDERINDM